MSQLVRICSAAELPAEGQAREFEAGYQTVCVARVNGVIHAMHNECPHRGGPLGQGLVEDGRIVCPWHAWAFDVATGEAEHNPQERVEVYPLVINGHDVSVEI